MIWMLKLNQSKCHHVRFSKNSVVSKSYYLDNESRAPLASLDRERDLGIIFNQSLKFEEHITNKINIAKRNLFLIRKTFRYLEPDVFLNLYKSLVRPHLEFGSPIWNVFNRTIERKIENIQKIATSYVHSIGHLSYPERLQNLNMHSLKFRRIRDDIITLFKIAQNDFPEGILNMRRSQNLRGHKFSLEKKLEIFYY